MVLIRFEVGNFRSILDPVELSMVAVDRGREAARPVLGVGESVLTVAAVFGPNGSGKSTVLAALAWLRDAVRDSAHSWDERIPVQPHALAAEQDGRCGFTIDSVIDGVRCEYVLEFDRDAVRYEALFHYPQGRRRRVFERDGDELIIQRGMGRLSSVRELLTPSALVLSVARRWQVPVVSGFTADLLAMSVLDGRGTGGEMHWCDPQAMPERHALAVQLARLVDDSIDDVIVERSRETPDAAWRMTGVSRRVAGEAVVVDVGEESGGVRAWCALVVPIAAALETGSLVLIDGLGGRLHPRVSAAVIGLFQSSVTNPRGAQLVLTCHDVSLLNHLNRDEVWFTEKTADGATRLGALAEFAGERVRTSQNLERAYLAGRFGAIPDVDGAAAAVAVTM
ncbi:AAA family ATPase [Amycolatopsis sp. NPDC004378]